MNDSKYQLEYQFATSLPAQDECILTLTIRLLKDGPLEFRISPGNLVGEEMKWLKPWRHPEEELFSWK